MDKEDLNENIKNNDDSKNKNKNINLEEAHDSHTINTEKDSNKSIEEFTYKMNEFMNSIPNNKYIFEITKLCGYSEFVLINKDESILELYKAISHQFECREIKSLFLACGNNRYSIPLTNIVSLRKFITDIQKDGVLRQFIIPVYQLPAPVVYRIYFDDGHTHN
jgi:hypothetical protein